MIPLVARNAHRAARPGPKDRPYAAHLTAPAGCRCGNHAAARRPLLRPQQLEATGVSHDAAVLAEFKHMLNIAGVRLPDEMVVNGDYDATLRRFLRARKYSLDAAFAMLESE